MVVIRLFCAGGASTSILARKMREAAQRRGIDVEVTFGGVHNLEQMKPKGLEQADVALLGPQVGFSKQCVEQKCKDAGVPLAVIPMRDYGICDGDAVLDLAFGLWIVENGIGWDDQVDEDGHVHDDYRIDYLQKNLSGMRDAIEIDGIPLMGYLMWGCIDLVSISTGEFKKRYGFVYVDKHDDGTGDLRRIRKDSFTWYKQLIASNGETLN